MFTLYTNPAIVVPVLRGFGVLVLLSSRTLFSKIFLNDRMALFHFVICAIKNILLLHQLWKSVLLSRSELLSFLVRLCRTSKVLYILILILIWLTYLLKNMVLSYLVEFSKLKPDTDDSNRCNCAMFSQIVDALYYVYYVTLLPDLLLHFRV